MNSQLHDNKRTNFNAKNTRSWPSWLPGLLLTIVSGIITYAVVQRLGNNQGLALFLSVPVSFGAILGYTTSIRLWWKIALIPIAVILIISILTMTPMIGLFCGWMLALLLVVPAFIGVILGWALQRVLHNHLTKRTTHLMLLIVVLMPICHVFIENRVVKEAEAITVSTVFDIPADAPTVWNHIMFYEQIDRKRPLLLKLGLPKPIGIEGSRRAVGDIARCIYDRGYIVKRMKQVVFPTVLVFDVIEQSIHFERDVTLIDGSFHLEAIQPNLTQVTLHTSYISHLRPIWLSLPIEKRVIKTLHRHVLETITLNIKSSDDVSVVSGRRPSNGLESPNHPSDS